MSNREVVNTILKSMVSLDSESNPRLLLGVRRLIYSTKKAVCMYCLSKNNLWFVNNIYVNNINVNNVNNNIYNNNNNIQEVIVCQRTTYGLFAI